MKIYKLVVCLWIISLFDPARLISYYIPGLSPLLWVRELLLYGTFLMWLSSSAPKKNMKWFMAFIGVTLFGTGIAFLTGNWGVAREVVREMFPYYALGIMTISLFNTPERAITLLRLYFFFYLYYAIWGLISLKLSPLAGDIDPAARQIIYWHIYFDNRDGFGPLMVMGFAYSVYIYRAMRGRLYRLLASASVFLCIVGILTSFGRGAALAFMVSIGHIWLHTKRKFVTAIALVAITVVFLSAAPQFAQRYWDTVKTISTEGVEGGTGRDRKILWGWAWREFVSSPIYGVGTGNFGIALIDIVGYDEAVAAGYTPGRLWRRSLHCAPMSVLCEYGLIGSVIMWFLLADVFRTNRRIRKNVIRFAKQGGQRSFQNNFIYRPYAAISVSNGLNAVLLAIIISALFYEILYMPIFWNLIVINRVVYLVTRNYEQPGESELT